MNEDEIEISIIQTPLSKPGQVEFGVEIKHIHTGIIVKSVNKSSQHLNKLEALKFLDEKLTLK
jgi:protein subunit release factor A